MKSIYTAVSGEYCSLLAAAATHKTTSTGAGLNPLVGCQLSNTRNSSVSVSIAVSVGLSSTSLYCRSDFTHDAPERGSVRTKTERDDVFKKQSYADVACSCTLVWFGRRLIFSCLVVESHRGGLSYSTSSEPSSGCSIGVFQRTGEWSRGARRHTANERRGDLLAPRRSPNNS